MYLLIIYILINYFNVHIKIAVTDYPLWSNSISVHIRDIGVTVQKCFNMPMPAGVRCRTLISVVELFALWSLWRMCRAPGLKTTVNTRSQQTIVGGEAEE